MALLSWLDRRVDEPKAGILSGIDLKYVLDTHHMLKKKLLDEMDGTGAEPLDVTTISQDDVCAIGKWLYGEGKTLYG
ncbi:MAG TPA: CZB domain-containing protein, partial [Methylotenera sp.]|nr:CZB domain-containing protein [Methylotenera sp.]